MITENRYPDNESLVGHVISELARLGSDSTKHFIHLMGFLFNFGRYTEEEAFASQVKHD